jgi:hypothetical protein
MAKKQTTDEIIESGVCHFRIGENFGALLASIAQEHLTERNNPVLALKTITESLHGCPTDIAVRILKGDIVLIVNEEDQNCLPVDRIPAIHDAIFPKIDPVYFLESRARNIKMHGGYILDGLKALQYQIKKDRGYFTIDFKYEDIFKFVAGDNEALLEELRDNRDIDGIASLFEATKRFIEETMKTQSTMEWIMQTFDEFSKSKNYEYYMQLRGEVADVLVDIAFHLNQTLKLDFSLDAPVDNVQNYIDSARAIDEVISKGIEPVDIMKNWSAGWLAPNGDYYGLNGEIANMLHNQIADALQEIGIVPKKADEEVGAEINPDAWLEQHGWVKIHSNNINFAGCCNVRIGKKNVDLTNVQIKKIYEYCAICHNGVVKAGWRLEIVTAIRFKDIAESNLEGLYKKYFEF